MIHPSATNTAKTAPFEQLRFAGEILRSEGQALLGLADQLDGDFNRAIDLLFECRGSVIVSGMGKAGLIGQKIVATLASTGTRSHFLHPGEAVHGDLGRVHRDDVILMLSFSGETEEITRLLPPLAELGVPIIAVTGGRESSLGQAARVVLDLGSIHEACPLGLAPSTSTTAMLAMGDALGPGHQSPPRVPARRFRALPSRRQPGPQAGPGRGTHATARAMPRGLGRSIGAPSVRGPGSARSPQLAPSCSPTTTAACVACLPIATSPACLKPAAMPISTGPMREVMTAGPAHVVLGTRLPDAVRLLATRKFSELPIVDSEGRPAGLLGRDRYRRPAARRRRRDKRTPPGPAPPDRYSLAATTDSNNRSRSASYETRPALPADSALSLRCRRSDDRWPHRVRQPGHRVEVLSHSRRNGRKAVAEGPAFALASSPAAPRKS